eukprot:CAMPEP_0182450068 /NCGR_PEP_ID=MMETSP1172-20130603/38719_1 /TAXON_ID=708627 /ORGANISM="Timspurckia oligopyrenoides, Strain CCMP3278" /LENGTH=133 /DNA_ID=CAMNT_0024647553 /DNA_START=103 /DNA_END=501 /DNA_ORIENTATION=+
MIHTLTHSHLTTTLPPPILSTFHSFTSYKHAQSSLTSFPLIQSLPNSLSNYIQSSFICTYPRSLSISEFTTQSDELPQKHENDGRLMKCKKDHEVNRLVELIGNVMEIQENTTAIDVGIGGGYLSIELLMKYG